MTSKLWASVIRSQLSWPVRSWGKKNCFQTFGGGGGVDFIELVLWNFLIPRSYFIQLPGIKNMFNPYDMRGTRVLG